MIHNLKNVKVFKLFDHIFVIYHTFKLILLVKVNIIRYLIVATILELTFLVIKNSC